MSKCYGESRVGFAKEMEDLYKDYEKFINMDDLLNDLNDETGAMIGEYMILYNKVKDLSLKVLKRQDEMYDMLMEIQSSNLELRKQNGHLRDAIFECNKTKKN